MDVTLRINMIWMEYKNSSELRFYSVKVMVQTMVAVMIYLPSKTNIDEGNS